MKKFLLVVLALFVLTATGCFDTPEDVTDDLNGVEEENIYNETNDEAQLPFMTVEEVAENDGVDGANAYVIVDGIVYDVTDSARWTEGLHNDFQAGQDLTDEIENISPHGLDVLDNMPQVGQIVE